ncbi:MAG: hypothetical protein M2R45_03437 [Verrucomicrobia subdivision 3 bacterium]|nr:hypothetical protein [Limisphaerales bacterium]MCS1416341.1 hypothetical protein [Limisphaerales bacterium]
MTFLQPFILFGLPLVLLPIIIHLLNRLRHRPQPWGAMQFLLAATRSSINQARLRQFFILLFRTLAVLALVLFLARPLAGGWLGWAVSTAPDVIFLLIDRSASMEHLSGTGAASKREEVLRLMAESVKEFEETSHLILIDSASRQPQPLAHADSLLGHPLTSATDAAADIPAMLQSTLSWLVENQAGNAEIWIGSDLQSSNWQTQDARWPSLTEKFLALPQTVKIRLLVMNSSTSQTDVSLGLHEQTHRIRQSSREGIFSLDVDRTTDSSSPLPIELNLDEVSSELTLEPTALKQRWRYRVDLGSQEASGWGSFSVPSDANNRNNTVYFVYGQAGKLGATVVATDPIAGAILQIAAGDYQTDPPQIAQLRSSWNAAADAWQNQTLILWQEELPAPETAARLETFIQEGGVVLFLPPDETGDHNFHGIGWGTIVRPTSEESFRVGRWERISGPLADTDEGFSLPFDLLDVHQHRELTGYESVSASFTDGSPLLVRKTIGQGAAYFLTTLPRSDWSTLSDGTVLIPLIQRLLQAGARRQEKAIFATSGELDPALENVFWTPFGGRDTADFRWNAGVYRSGERWLAVNRAEREDEPGRLEIDEARLLFGDLPLAMQQEKNEADQSLQGEAWRLFLLGMLAFLMMEGFLILPTGQNQTNPINPSPAI